MGYLVRFKDKGAKETASKSKQWLKELGSGVKLVKPRFGVIVHYTPTNEVQLQEDKERSINKIISENDLENRGFGIEEIAWLKKKDFILTLTVCTSSLMVLLASWHQLYYSTNCVLVLIVF
jgi:hypothetical protein